MTRKERTALWVCTLLLLASVAAAGMRDCRRRDASEAPAVLISTEAPDSIRAGKSVKPSGTRRGGGRKAGKHEAPAPRDFRGDRFN